MGGEGREIMDDWEGEVVEIRMERQGGKVERQCGARAIRRKEEREGRGRTTDKESGRRNAV